MRLTLAELAERIDARLEGDPAAVIRRLAPLDGAGPGALCFAEAPRFAEQVAQGQAEAVVVGEDFPELRGRNLLRAADPRIAFLRAMELFAPPPPPPDIDPGALIAADAQLGDRVRIAAGAVIAAGARIGTGTRIDAGAYVGAGVRVGRDCHVEPNACLLAGVSVGDRCTVHAGAVIGGDGFGYRWLGDHHHKIPQLGGVVIEDDVEIGCNSCVDRATLGSTRIGRGTKIDNLVQVGHNVEIGEDVVVVAQVAFGGSAAVGPGSVVAGQAAISDHVRVGSHAQIGGQSGVTRDVDDRAVVFGTPARDLKRTLREQAALARLPELLRQVKVQQREIEGLRLRLQQMDSAGEHE